MTTPQLVLDSRPRLKAMVAMTLVVAAAYGAPAFAAPSPKAAAASAAKESPQSAPAAGMVITGDREAPLVMSIIPWAEPKPVVPPEAPLLPLLPQVIDYNRSLVDDPVNRPINPAPRGTAAK